MPLPATEKLLRLRAIEAAVSSGISFNTACRNAQVAPGSAMLWKSTLASRGTLTDARRDKSGRKPAVNLTPVEAAALRALVLQRRLSEDSAIRAFIKSPDCSAQTRAFIKARLAAGDSAPRQTAKKPRWPDSLRRAAHVTAAEIERWYGPDATRAAEIVTQRRLTWQHNGVELPLRPHTIWQFDDYSTNKPYWLQYAEGKFRVCRQILAGLDTFTRGWLGFYHVGKERDAYTGADCLKVILLCLDAHGTRPEVIILEQGRWKGNALRGLEVDGLASRWGDIQEAGFIVEYTTDSRGKAEIEGEFHPLQIELEGGADIGHTRGLHERESDNYLAVNAGRRDPRHCGFGSLPDSEEAHYQAAALLNARRKERQELGYASADELFAEFPVEQNPLPAEHRWLFECPHKQEATVGSISRSLVGCTVHGTQHLFVVNGIRADVFFDDGHRVLIAFDPEQPQKGCVVANADTSTKNRENWRLGQMLLGGAAGPAADQWGTVPRLVVNTDGRQHRNEANDEHWKKRKDAIRAAQTGFTAILPGGKRGLRVQSRRNRQGDIREIVIPSDGMEPPVSPNQPNAILGSAAQTGVLEPAEYPRTRGNRPGDSDSPPKHYRLKTRPSAPAAGRDDDTAPPRPDFEEDLDAMEAAAMREAGVFA